MGAANGQARPVFHEVHLSLEPARRRHVIGIHPRQVAPACSGSSRFERADQTHGLLTDHADAAVPGRPVGECVGGVVGGAVIDRHDLEVAIALARQRRCGLDQVRHPVPHG